MNSNTTKAPSLPGGGGFAGAPQWQWPMSVRVKQETKLKKKKKKQPGRRFGAKFWLERPEQGELCQEKNKFSSSPIVTWISTLLFLEASVLCLETTALGRGRGFG